MHPKYKKLLDIHLVDMIAGNLKLFGAPVDDHVKKLRVGEHGVTGQVDMLESYYSRTSYHDFYLGSDCSFHEARCVESVFYFITRRDQSVSIRMVYRTPHRHHPDRSVSVYVNDTANTLGCLPMSKKWAPGSFTIDKSMLREGVNKLTVVWPYSSEPWKIEGEISDRSLLKAIFPVLGNIHMLTMISKPDNGVSKPDIIR